MNETTLGRRPPLMTTDFEFAQGILARVHGSGDIGVVHGPTGTGKTFAVRHYLQGLGRDGTFVTMGKSPSPKRAVVKLTRALLGTCDSNRSEYDLHDDLAEVLKDSQRMVVIDEADKLTQHNLETLQSLHQEGDYTWSLVLVGTTIDTKVRALPELENRIEGWAPFSRMQGAALLATTAQMSPLLAGAAPADLRALDDAYARGLMRNWARVARAAEQYAAQFGANALTPEFIAALMPLIARRDA